MEATKKRCSDCEYWDFRSNNFGFCRANGPRATIVKGTSSDEYTLVWPSTGRDDWCNQFKPVRELEAVK